MPGYLNALWSAEARGSLRGAALVAQQARLDRHDRPRATGSNNFTPHRASSKDTSALDSAARRHQAEGCGCGD